MIDFVTKGWDAKGLVRYLMGPGKFNEHTRPRVVAAWQSDPGALQPTRAGEGDFDFTPESYSRLLEHVDAPAEAAGLGRRQPAEGAPGYTKHGYVWHCSLSIGPEDGDLDLDRWNEIARDVMHRTGIAPQGDPGGCRWIAVHHGRSGNGNDHIHIAAVLVRQDTGKRYYPTGDFKEVRQAMRFWEDRLELRATAIDDGTAAPAASRGESEKAAVRARRGYDGLSRGEAGMAARVQLRQVVTETAAMSESAEEFLAGLREQGVLVHLRRDEGGRIVGYAVADPEDRDKRTGRPIFFGGRKLAPELSWVKLDNGWDRQPAAAQSSTGADRLKSAQRVVGDAAAAARSACDAVRDRTEPVGHVAGGLRSLLATWARTAEGAQTRGALSEASWNFDRAARSPRVEEVKAPGEAAAALLRSSRELSMLSVLSGRGQQRPASLELALAVSALLLEIAAWQEHKQRQHQADAAFATARSVGRFGEETNAIAPSPAWRPVAVPDHGQARDRMVTGTRRAADHPPAPPTARSWEQRTPETHRTRR